MIEYINDNLEIIKIVITLLGGVIALLQWKKSNDYKRAEFVQRQIEKIRDDEDIAFIMDVIDWKEGFYYDGKFHLNKKTLSQYNHNKISSNEFFRKVDKTLAHYSYICYLKDRKILKKKDIELFNYHIRRIVDNEHIANYLYSLYHWARSIHAECSFEYLIEYALDKGFLSNKFTIYSDKGIGEFRCYLWAMEEYAEKYK